VIDHFIKESTSLPGQVRKFVLNKLAEYAQQNPSIAQGPVSVPISVAPSSAPLADPFTLDLPDQN
jgi:hypothetical protein